MLDVHDKNVLYYTYETVWIGNTILWYGLVWYHMVVHTHGGVRGGGETNSCRLTGLIRYMHHGGTIPPNPNLYYPPCVWIAC